MPAHAADQVPVEGLREAFLRLQRSRGLTTSELAQRLGWTRPVRGRQAPDATSVKRALGLAAHPTNGRRRQTVSYDLAVLLVEAMDLDPVDLGPGVL